MSISQESPRGPGTAALHLENLTKAFGNTRAVNDLNLTIPRGSFYGIVGPNGAGKTTTITMATGLLRPTSGQAYICGHEVWPPSGGNDAPSVLAAKRSFGLLADSLPVFDRLHGREYLEYLGLLRGLDATTISTRTQDLLAAMDLLDAQDKMIADYSTGMTKKILLAGALLHSPELLILDEPFEAVDPVSARVIREILNRFVSSGGTVVLSSHSMQLIESLCTHVAIIASGTVRTAGTLDDVRAGKSLDDRFVELVGGRNLGAQDLGWLQGGDRG